MGQYVPRVVRRAHLTGTHGHQAYDGKLLLGEITDNVVTALEMYGESSVDIVNSHNRKRGLGESNCQVREPFIRVSCSLTSHPDRCPYLCQDWALIIIRSLEDSQLLPGGTLAKAEKCPRLG